jgi:WD40 repeat protein
VYHFFVQNKLWLAWGMGRMGTFERFRVGCVVALGLLANLGLAAVVLPKEPVLRIETGSHLAPITRISSDAAGRWIVTSSEDKTARLWDGRTGRAISVLRPPIGADSLGAIYAASLSPDGKTVALGGNSDFDGSSGHLLHLFDRARASVPPKSTVGGLEAPITQLAWSRDSEYLAIGLRQQGLRVFRRSLQFVGADPEFNEAIFGADFAKDGRLAVTSLDGAVRLYQAGPKGLDRIARKQLPAGKPYGLAFSGDGRTLAVGYQDQARVDLLDATTLELSYSIELKGGNLGRVAWSADGKTLFAAGSYSSSGHFPVLAFDQSGRGAQREIGSFQNTVLSLAALPDGAVAAASAEPSWAVFTSAGTTRVASRAQSADFRDTGDNFRISRGGETVAFRMSAQSEPLVFDASAGNLKSVPAPAQTTAARTRGDANDWRNRQNPKFNGRALGVLPGEVARSLALASDDKSLVLGSDWFVRRFSVDGALAWERRVGAAAWAVNVSGDGRWAVCALADGSIRWLRMSDGVEQLALFVHSDRSRWIAWTPSGYYDTSVGGEDLVGWHLNREFNQSADFFTAGRFRDQLYRPEVVNKVLAAGDEREAVRLANATTIAAIAPHADDVVQVLPPVVELRSEPVLQTSSNTIPVRYEMRSPGDAPVTGLKARVNGRLVRNLNGRGLREVGVQQIDVPLPATGDVEIMLFAENKFGKSDPVVVKVVRAAEAPKGTLQEKYDKLYLLVVGISKYPGDFALEFPHKDAADFSSNMLKQKGLLYNDVQLRLLVDQDATRDAVLDGLKWMRERVTERDAGVVFFAGHGDKVANAYYFIPGDINALPAAGQITTAKDMDAWKLKNGPALWISGDEIGKTLLGLKGRAAFFIDTCHAGQAANQAIRGNASMTGALNEINEERGVIIFASSTGKETSQEDANWGNGAFTKAIIEGIGGKADRDNSGLIRPSYLSAYVNDRVRALTGNEQRPVIFTVGIDDPIAVKTK